MKNKNDIKGEKNNKNSKSELVVALSLVTHLGVIMFITIGISLAIGYFLDIWLHTTPIFIIIFIFIGLGASIRNMYIMLTKSFKK